MTNFALQLAMNILTMQLNNQGSISKYIQAHSTLSPLNIVKYLSHANDHGDIQVTTMRFDHSWLKMNTWLNMVF